MSSTGNPGDSGFSVLRRAALVATMVGAGGSVGLMLYAGRHNDSRILRLLFTVWVVSPFLAGALAGMVSKRWSAAARASLNVVLLVLTLASLIIYADVAFGHPAVK